MTPKSEAQRAQDRANERDERIILRAARLLTEHPEYQSDSVSGAAVRRTRAHLLALLCAGAPGEGYDHAAAHAGRCGLPEE